MLSGEGSARKEMARQMHSLIQSRAFSTHPSLSKPPRLIGCYCRTCGAYSFPWNPACTYCNCPDVEKVCLSRRGRLETFSILRRAVPGYKDATPFAIGSVALPEGVTLRALLGGCNPEELRTGMEVELDLIKVSEDHSGYEVLAQAFRPV